MSDIFNEVDEALKKERAQKLWQEYGPTLVVAAIVMVLSTGAFTAYRSWDQKKNEAQTAALITAAESTNAEQALAEFAQDARAGHKAVALMSAAAQNVAKDNRENAATLYRQIFEDGSIDDSFRDLARILYVRLTTQEEAKEQTGTQNLLNILQPVLKDKNNPWIWHARIEAALIQAHKQDDYAQAIETLEPFETENTIPLSLKQRAKALIHVYTLKTPKVEKTTQETSGS